MPLLVNYTHRIMFDKYCCFGMARDCGEQPRRRSCTIDSVVSFLGHPTAAGAMSPMMLAYGVEEALGISGHWVVLENASLSNLAKRSNAFRGR